MKNLYQLQEEAAQEAIEAALHAVSRAQLLSELAGWGLPGSNGWVQKPLADAYQLVRQAAERANQDF